ncbi:MAG: CarD family transcriptional regulator [Treponema sp.]|jgi:CarD family transcriptional regulator|nr:CarD family transcriptional regulator [Treponema sp.]
MNMDYVHPEFHVDQQVVYPSQGVGKIKAIENRNFKGVQTPYYVIYFEVSDMISMIPVEKAYELGIRPIVSPEEAEEALDFIGEKYDPMPSDWKLRYQLNLDLLKKGSVMDIAAIVRSLYHRSQIKELPIMERKLYDSAKKLMEDEIAFSLSKNHEDVERMIFERLECAASEEGIADYEPEGNIAEPDDGVGNEDGVDPIDPVEESPNE